MFSIEEGRVPPIYLLFSVACKISDFSFPCNIFMQKKEKSQLFHSRREKNGLISGLFSYDTKLGCLQELNNGIYILAALNL